MRKSQQNLPPKEVKAKVLMGRTSAAYTMGITLLILATLWKPAQKSAEQTSGCRFSSLRHCGRLSGGPFKRTTSRKRNGRGTPSFSSKGCSKKVALPGPERTGFARTFALLHKTSATIAGVAGNGHSVLAPAPPKETQWSALQPGLPVKEPYSLPPRQAGLPHLPIPTLPDAASGAALKTCAVRHRQLGRYRDIATRRGR